MGEKSVLYEKNIQSQFTVGVARHSLMGRSVYGAQRQSTLKKVKQSKCGFFLTDERWKESERKKHDVSKKWQNEKTMPMDRTATKGLCLHFFKNIQIIYFFTREVPKGFYFHNAIITSSIHTNKKTEPNNLHLLFEDIVYGTSSFDWTNISM